MSDKQLAANRLNAQKSTGPRTPEGKARVCKNARKHGLTGRDTVLPSERADDYDSFREGLLDDLAPSGDLEEVLSDRIVSYAWRLRRVPMIEAGLHRRVYQARRVEEASNEVRKFERPIFREPAAELTDLAAHAIAQRQLDEETKKLEAISRQIVDPFEKSPVVLANLWRYETMLSRSLERTLHELQRIQAARTGAYVTAPSVVDVNVDLTPSSSQGGDDVDGSAFLQNKPIFR
jgi:hypothetical protein